MNLMVGWEGAVLTKQICSGRFQKQGTFEPAARIYGLCNARQRPVCSWRRGIRWSHRAARCAPPCWRVMTAKGRAQPEISQRRPGLRAGTYTPGSSRERQCSLPFFVVCRSNQHLWLWVPAQGRDDDLCMARSRVTNLTDSIFKQSAMRGHNFAISPNAFFARYSFISRPLQ